jgi:hypothetical protein
MTVAAVTERPACEGAHTGRWPAETWSWVFGKWLCYTCLSERTVRESLRTPGAAFDGWKKPSGS